MSAELQFLAQNGNDSDYSAMFNYKIQREDGEGADDFDHQTAWMVQE
jgi:hypothetical protein